MEVPMAPASADNAAGGARTTPADALPRAIGTARRRVREDVAVMEAAASQPPAEGGETGGGTDQPADPSQDALWRRLRSSVTRAEFVDRESPRTGRTMDAEANDTAAVADSGEAAATAGTGRVERHDDVVSRVRELIEKYPTIGSRQLYDFAVRKHPELEEAGFRSFHARYVLPLKREKARAEGRVPKPRRSSAEKVAAATPRRRRRSQPAQDAAAAAEATAADTSQLRTRVRDVMLRLARQVAVAETRAELIDAMAGMESMVDEVVAALTTSPASADDA